MPPEAVFQVPTLPPLPTLCFGSDHRHEHVDQLAVRAGIGSDQTASTVWRPPPIQVSRSVWRHEVRSLVGGYRVCVPQLPAVIGDAAVVAGLARQDQWELRGRRRSE